MFEAMSTVAVGEVVKRAVARTGPAWTWVGGVVGLLTLISWQGSLGGAPTAPLVWVSDRLHLSLGWADELHQWVIDPERIEFLILVGRLGTFALIAGAAVDELLRARSLDKFEHAYRGAAYYPMFRTVDGSRRRHPITEDEKAAHQRQIEEQDEKYLRIYNQKQAFIGAQVDRMRRSGGTLWLLIGLLAETGKISTVGVVTFAIAAILAIALGWLVGVATSSDDLERGDFPGALLVGAAHTAFLLAAPAVPLIFVVGWITGSWG